MSVLRRLAVVVILTAGIMTAVGVSTASALEPLIWENPGGESYEILFPNGRQETVSKLMMEEAAKAEWGVGVDGGFTGQKDGVVSGMTERAKAAAEKIVAKMRGNNSAQQQLFNAEKYKGTFTDPFTETNKGWWQVFEDLKTVPTAGVMLKALGTFTWALTAWEVGWFVGGVFDSLVGIGGTKEIVGAGEHVDVPTANYCSTGGGCLDSVECATSYHVNEGEDYLTTGNNNWCILKGGFLTNVAPCYKPAIEGEPYLPNGAIEAAVEQTAGCSNSEGSTGRVSAGLFNAKAITESGLTFPGGSGPGSPPPGIERREVSVPAPAAIPTPVVPPTPKELETGKKNEFEPIPPARITVQTVKELEKYMKEHGESVPGKQPGTPELPDPTKPEGPLIPQPSPGETGIQYKERLEKLGLKKVTLATLPEQAIDAKVGPEGVSYVVPAVGIEVSAETPIVVEQNPSTAPTPSETHALFTAPKAELHLPSFGHACSNFPFGVPCWLLGVIERWSSIGKAPVVEVPFVKTKLVIDLKVVEPVMEVVRPVFVIAGTIGIVMTFFSFAIGSAGGVTGGDE